MKRWEWQLRLKSNIRPRIGKNTYVASNPIESSIDLPNYIRSWMVPRILLIITDFFYCARYQGSENF